MPAKALLIYYELDKRRCAYLIVAALVLSVSAGMGTAMVTGRVDYGIGMSASISAWLACVEAVLLWLYR